MIIRRQYGSRLQVEGHLIPTPGRRKPQEPIHGRLSQMQIKDFLMKIADLRQEQIIEQ